MKISASYLSAQNKKEAIDKLNNTDVDYIHLDYMDGKFVEGKTETISELKKILKDNKKKLDIHIMGYPTENFIEQLAMFFAEYITIHVELKNKDKVIEKIKSYGLKVGLSIKPKTDINEIIKYLDQIDEVLVMSVEPGKGGQTFLEETYDRIRKLKDEISKNNYNVVISVVISVDGGINNENAQTLKELGANIIVVGSFITDSENYQNQIDLLK